MERCVVENCVSCTATPEACVQCQRGYQLINSTCIATDVGVGEPFPLVTSIAVLASLGFILGLVVCMVCVVAVVNCRLMHKRRGHYSVDSEEEDSVNELPDDHDRTENATALKYSTNTADSATSPLAGNRTFDPILTARSFVQQSTPVQMTPPTNLPTHLPTHLASHSHHSRDVSIHSDRPVETPKDLYVANWNDDCVQIFSKKGRFLRTFSTRGSGPSNPQCTHIEHSTNVDSSHPAQNTPEQAEHQAHPPHNSDADIDTPHPALSQP